MLDHLGAENAAQRAIGQVAHIVEQVGTFRVESLSAAERDGLLAQVDPARLDTGVAHHLEKFAATAAYVEHRRALPKALQIELDVLPDVVLGTAEALSEPRIVECGCGAGRRRARLPASGQAISSPHTL